MFNVDSCAGKPPNQRVFQNADWRSCYGFLNSCSPRPTTVRYALVFEEVILEFTLKKRARVLESAVYQGIPTVIVVGLLFAAAGCGRSNGDGQKADSTASATQPDAKPILAVATGPTDASQPSATSAVQSPVHTEDSDWERAVSTNTLDAYLEYLKQYPQSERVVVRHLAVSTSFAFLTATIDRFAPEDRKEVPAIGQSGIETSPGTVQWMLYTDAQSTGGVVMKVSPGDSGVALTSGPRTDNAAGKGIGIGVEVPDLPLPRNRAAYLLTPGQAKRFGLVGQVSEGSTMLAGLDATGSKLEIVYRESGDHYKIISVKVSAPGAMNPPERLGTVPAVNWNGNFWGGIPDHSGTTRASGNQ